MFVNEHINIFIETCFTAALFLNTLLYLPQIIKLWYTKEAGGLSVFMFGGFNLIQILTILHSCINGDYFLMAGTISSLIACFAVTVQLVMYKMRDRRCVSKTQVTEKNSLEKGVEISHHSAAASLKFYRHRNS